MIILCLAWKCKPDPRLQSTYWHMMRIAAHVLHTCSIAVEFLNFCYVACNYLFNTSDLHHILCMPGVALATTSDNAG